MNKFLLSSAALALTATGALAGGLDRSGQGIGIIFKDGNYAELSFGSVSPDISGTAVPILGGVSSGNMAPDYTQLGFGIKTEINDNIDFALIFDKPFGGDVAYPTGTGYFAQGATATVDSSAFTAVLNYQINERVSVHAGLRTQSIETAVEIPAGPYVLETEKTSGTGYLVGAAYEIPDIALRVALTYNSEIEHSQNITENGLLNTVVEFASPQSVNLDFQTGVAADTLVFGSVRWVEWSAFDFAPAGYAAANMGSSLLSYDDDTITYSIGVGRRINEQLSVAATIGYEASTGGFSGNLGPTDGSTSFGLGATYTMDNIEVTGGIRYVKVGDAVVQNPLAPGTDGANFTDNSALGVGLKIGYNF